ncbi:MAG: replication initiator protein [Microviridae sp.]|nr:MAG: replication initiator protein [Microviridae sp.]
MGSRWIDTGKGAELVPFDVSKTCSCWFRVTDRQGREHVVPGGKCDSCKKFRVTNLTGTLMQEAAFSGSTWFVSLTYADEHLPPGDGWNRKHITHLMMRLRYYHPGIRFYCVAELGDKNKRPHWHLLLFFPEYTPVPYLRRGYPARGGRPAVRGELWEHWEYGFSTIRAVKTDSPDDFVAQIRYCALYAQKQWGVEGVPRPRFSCYPVLGHRFLMEQALRYARVNEGKLRLPLYVQFPGVRVCKGGELWKFPILGARRGHYIRAYYAEVERLYGPNQWLGGSEALDKVKTKDLIGQRAADELFRKAQCVLDLRTFEQVANAARSKILSLRERWLAYDDKEARYEHAASFAAYSQEFEFIDSDGVVQCYG